MNNLIKEKFMNKLTKVGLSALAGSLAAVSAHAVDYAVTGDAQVCLLYTSPSPRDQRGSRMPSSA